MTRDERIAAARAAFAEAREMSEEAYAASMAADFAEDEARKALDAILAEAAVEKLTRRETP